MSEEKKVFLAKKILSRTEEMYGIGETRDLDYD